MTRRRDALVRAATAKQPPPGGGGRAVFDVAMQFLAFDDDMVEALHARSEKGQAKYHQPLRTVDGRNSWEEQMQKALDGYVYSVKDYMEGPGSLAVVAAWIRVVVMLGRDPAARGADRDAAAATLRRMGMSDAEIQIAIGLA